MVRITQTNKLRAAAASLADDSIDLYEGSGTLTSGPALMSGSGTVLSGDLPDWIAPLVILQWGQFPNSKHNSLTTSPLYGFPYHGNGPRSVIDNYSGSALRVWNGEVELIHFGAGHTDGAYNFMSKFQLHTSTPAWVRAIAHSASADILPRANPDGTLANGVQYYNDNTWAADHTYGILHHMGPIKDETWKVGSGSAFGQGGAGGSKLQKMTHGPDAYVPPAQATLTAPGSAFFSLPMAQHRTTKAIYYFTAGNALYRINPDETVSLINGNVGVNVGQDCPAAIDPERNRILKAPNPGDAQQRWYTFDCATGVPTQRTLTGSGTLPNFTKGCIRWDHYGNRYLGLTNSGDLVAINPTTFVYEILATTGTKPVNNGNGQQGLFSKFHILDEYGVAVAVLADNTDVYRIKLREMSAQVAVPFGVYSPTAGTKPFRFALPLKRGDIPSGSGIEADLTTYQTWIDTRWDDDSARIGMIAGYATVAAEVQQPISLQPGTAPSGIAIAESVLAAANPNVVVEFIPDTGQSALGTVQLAPLIGVASSGKGSAGRLRNIASGHVYSEWEYYSQVGSDAHLACFIQAGIFSGGEMWFCISGEAGWKSVASPGIRNYRLRITINGTVRFDDYLYHYETTAPTRISDFIVQLPGDVRHRVPIGSRVRAIGATTVRGTVQAVALSGDNTQITVLWDSSAVTPASLTSLQSLGHPHHTSWGMEFWYGTDPDITPVHNLSYLQATRLCNRYLFTGQIDPAAYVNLPQTVTRPFQRANMPSAMGAAGFDDSIGPETNWGAVYVASGAREAYKAVIVNAYASRQFAIQYRDEDTMEPVIVSDHPTTSINQSNSGISNGGSSANPTPVPSGAQPHPWANSHHPCPGYLAFILSGNEFHRRSVQFLASTCLFSMSTSARQGASVILSNQVRDLAWALRTNTLAAAITPAGDLQTEYLLVLANTINFYNNRRLSAPWNNDLGVIHVFSAFGQGGPDSQKQNDGKWDEPFWMHDFLTYVLAWTYWLRVLSGADETALKALRNFAYKSVIGRFGGQGLDQYCVRWACRNDHALLTPELGPAAGGTFLPNWGRVFFHTMGFENTDCVAGANLQDFYVDHPEGFSFSVWGNAFPALAAAVDDEIEEPGSAPGAVAALNRFRGAGNYTAAIQHMKVRAVWSIIPRNL